MSLERRLLAHPGLRRRLWDKAGKKVVSGRLLALTFSADHTVEASGEPWETRCRVTQREPSLISRHTARPNQLEAPSPGEVANSLQGDL